MKGLMILANGFEDVEAIATIDVLKRARVDLTIASLHEKDIVVTSHNNQLIVENYLKDINYVDYDFLIIPGGQAVFKELDGNELIVEIVNASQTGLSVLKNDDICFLILHSFWYAVVFLT